ncbi:AAA family ATPase [Ramlibacter sp.]|uniref:AAA family ATPase n=1 Tax=Ramlibacter sp. TaxID=1917967 RepID=UPI002CA26852|nr:AAA family ATPase [Ramlibacter sp.]HWI81806.1 AAA family ATPase [Ramlibacter sp.]
MKVAVISPNPQHLQQLGVLLDAGGHTAVLFDGGKTRMRAVAEEEQPQLMLVDGMCCDADELAPVEYVTTHHPGTAVILLCATQTPEFLLNSMRAGVREVLPSPAPAAAVQAAVERVEAKLAGARLGRQGKVLAFVPCKGGSGATFLATNLGYQLAETRSVLLIDMNLQFGDALAFVHDGKAASTLADLAKDIGRLDASLLAASTVKVTPNFSVLAAPDDLAQAMEIKPEHIDQIVAVAAANYDFVLLDMPRALDTIAIHALDRAHRIYAVLQAGLTSVRHAAKLLEVFRSLGYGPEKTELILNRYEKTNEIGVEEVRRSVGNVRVNTVPNSYKEVNASINHGDPLVKVSRTNTVARHLADLAAALSPRHEENRGLLGRLFRRA